MKNSKNVADVLKIHDTVFWGLHYTIFCIRISIRLINENYQAKWVGRDI